MDETHTNRRPLLELWVISVLFQIVPSKYAGRGLGLRQYISASAASPEWRLRSGDANTLIKRLVPTLSKRRRPRPICSL